jgi:hypothetical protein
MTTATTSKRRTVVRGLGEIALRVNNLGAMQRFYEDVIGLPLMNRFPNAACKGWGSSTTVPLHFCSSSQTRDCTETRRLMIRKISSLLILTLATWLNAQERPVAFVDVTVVPMDKEQTLPHQTVVVVGGRITQVASAASVKVPHGAMKIDGMGKFFMPGLADMHVHFIRPAAAGQFQPSASSDYARENQALALIFVANGVAGELLFRP